MGEAPTPCGGRKYTGLTVLFRDRIKISKLFDVKAKFDEREKANSSGAGFGAEVSLDGAKDYEELCITNPDQIDSRVHHMIYTRNRQSDSDVRAALCGGSKIHDALRSQAHFNNCDALSSAVSMWEGEFSNVFRIDSVSMDRGGVECDSGAICFLDLARLRQFAIKIRSRKR